MNLQEKTIIIQQREKTIQLSFWDIGNELLVIKQDREFKESYNSFEEYVESNFKFTVRHANRMIAVAEQYKKETVSQIGLSKLYLLLQVPEDYRDEVIKRVEESGTSMSQITKKIKGLKYQAGTIPDYTTDKTEFELKLIRQANEIKEIIDNLVISVTNWLNGAEKSQNQELLEFKAQFKKILDKLK